MCVHCIAFSLAIQPAHLLLYRRLLNLLKVLETASTVALVVGAVVREERRRRR